MATNPLILRPTWSKLCQNVAFIRIFNCAMYQLRSYYISPEHNTNRSKVHLRLFQKSACLAILKSQKLTENRYANGSIIIKPQKTIRKMGSIPPEIIYKRPRQPKR